jgi:2,4-dienoyl-CoA reductase-like NADH-dependent reductase (Old Yellow Enzyme family)/thioredoxin reductase
MTVKQSFQGNKRALFESVELGPLTLPNRIVMAPMAVHLAPMTGEINEETIQYFLARANGGAGLIMMGATGWARTDAAHPSVPYDKVPFYNEDRLDGHKRLLEALKKTKSLVGIQINHRGRQGTRKPFDCPPVGPSDIPWSPKAEVPEPLSKSEINNLVERYGRASENAKKLGFDLVEIHAAHGYLVSNFLSPDANLRKDSYGGDIHGRASFLLDIIARVRETVGDDFPVSVRLNGADFTKNGLTLEESIIVAGLLKESGVDLISISAGVYGSYPMTIPPFYTGKGCFVPLSTAIREAVEIPVVVAGRICERPLAQSILHQEKADLVAVGRPLLADPNLPRKWEEQREGDVRKCIFCNYCIDSYWSGKNECTVNPLMGRETAFDLKPCKKPKTVWVIGAGLAGMEAAWRFSKCGHDVFLYDQAEQPGGQWLLAAEAPEKEHFRGLVDHLYKKNKEADVKIFLGVKIEKERILAGNPDAIIIATGAEPLRTLIRGMENEPTVTAHAVFEGHMPKGDRILVIGGGGIGLEVTHLLAEAGKQVTLVEMQRHLGPDMGATIRWALLRNLKKKGVKIIHSTEVISVDELHLYVVEKGEKRMWEKFSAYVMATGLKPRDELVGALQDFGGKILVIGDAKNPRRGADAIREGAEAVNIIGSEW